MIRSVGDLVLLLLWCIFVFVVFCLYHYRQSQNENFGKSIPSSNFSPYRWIAITTLIVWVLASTVLLFAWVSTAEPLLHIDILWVNYLDIYAIVLVCQILSALYFIQKTTFIFRGWWFMGNFHAQIFAEYRQFLRMIIYLISRQFLYVWLFLYFVWFV